jgi:Ca-activated chloride channel family protein
VVLLLLPVLAMASPQALAADPQNVMLVFDGSGSMWGRLENERQPKVVLARNAIRQALGTMPAQSRIGLTVFGHRRTGDCGDIEVMVRPQTNEGDGLFQALDKLNPKGRSPIATALREAAKALGPPTTPGSLVLVHDDPDNCQQDPCAAAAEINKAYPKLTINVVSLGLKRDDVQRMSCIARATGGKLYDARDAADVTKFIDEAMAAGSTTPVAPKPTPAARDQRPTPPPVKPGLYLSALLAAGATPLDIPVSWRVTRTGEPSTTSLYEAEASSAALFDLPAGRYDVEARLGLVSTKQTVEVDPATAQRPSIVLNAGTLRLATTQRGTLPGEGPVFKISKPQTGPGGASSSRPGDPLLVVRAPQSEIALAPGAYVISVAQGLARVDRSVVVAAGSRGQLNIPLATGALDLQAAASSGGPALDDAVFLVFEDDPEAPGGRRELARSAASQPSFILAAGTYHVVARQGVAEVRERVTVRPGETERRTLVTGTARVSLSATIANSRIDSTDNVAYRVSRLDGTPAEVASAAQQKAVFDLAPGRYRIESRLGALNARSERSVDLKAGAREELAMDHAAGVIRLTFAESAGATPVADVFWDIRNEKGETVWLTSEAQPLGILQAGAYTVRAEHRDRRFDGKFEVRPGDNRVIGLVAQ